MDPKEKVENALKSHFQVDHIQLVDDDGIYGFVVSPDFRDISALDRQTLIDQALRDPSVKLSKRERHRIRAIAPLTPVEYALMDHDGTRRRRSRRCIPGLKAKVENALKRCVQVEHIRLEDDEGISGFVVSPDFRDMAVIDRQTLIYHAVRDPSVKLSKSELRQILLIAALTPAEYESVDHEGGVFGRYRSAGASP